LLVESSAGEAAQGTSQGKNGGGESRNRKIGRGDSSTVVTQNLYGHIYNVWSDIGANSEISCTALRVLRITQ